MAHEHEEQRAYFLEQLCTIGSCGALGVVAILMYLRGWLGLLADPFHLPVLLGGSALLVVVLIRALALWQEAGARKAKEPCEHDHPGHEHDHGHSHAQEHAHSHAHSHSHGHAHDHEHGFAPIRYIVLLLPVTLFFLGMPNQAFIQRFQKYLTQFELGRMGQGDHAAGLMDLPGRSVMGMRLDRVEGGDKLKVIQVGKDSAPEKAGIKAGDFLLQIARTTDGDGNPLPKQEVIPAKGLSLDEAVLKLEGKPGTKVGVTIEHDGASKDVEITRQVELVALQFKELERAAYTGATRQYYEGKIGQVVGQFVPSNNPKSFSLTRFKMTCCAADAIPLNVVIVMAKDSPDGVTGLKPLAWVRVTGQIQFRKRVDRDEYTTVLEVKSLQDVLEVDPDPTPFIQ